MRPATGDLVVLAPNWLGDAVMLLPALVSIRRWRPDARLTVAARAAVAPLFTLVDGVDDVLTLGDGRGWAAILKGTDHAALGAGDYSTAILFPNSFHAAWIARRAGIPERWGFATDLRTRLLTRALPRPRQRLHQAEYYMALATALGAPPAPLMASLRIGDALRERARSLLQEHGWRGDPLIAFAPGAAYGAAKRWPPDRVGAAAARIAGHRAATAVVVGSPADARTAREVAGAFRRSMGGDRVRTPIDLTGRTDLPLLAAVLAESAAVVSNDSGAMHVAAAVGAPLAAIFGPTDETATAPLPHSSRAPVSIVTGQAWCRPCGLRTCPIDHRCMTSIGADRVAAEIERLLGRPPVRASGGAP